MAGCVACAIEKVNFDKKVRHALGRRQLAENQHSMPGLTKCSCECVCRRRPEIGVSGGKFVETTTIKSAGFDAGEGMPFENILSVFLEISNAVPGNPQSYDLPSSVIQRLRYRHDPTAYLEEWTDRIVGPEQGLSLLPAAGTAKSQQLLKPLAIQRPTDVQVAADTSIARQSGKRGRHVIIRPAKGGSECSERMDTLIGH